MNKDSLRELNDKLIYKGIGYFFIKVDVKSEALNESYCFMVPDIFKNVIQGELTQTSSYGYSIVNTLNKQDVKTLLKELSVITKEETEGQNE